jgi:methylated-DNA-[protein]-cysteine S-methyltransferase
MTLYHVVHPSPVGDLLLVASKKGLRALLWDDEASERIRVGDTIEDTNNPILRAAVSQLDEYFAGRLKKFTIKLDPIGTPFQLKVWDVLRRIPYGETMSYGEQAKAIGNPKASRAVGGANGKNPISIIVPCHRVIGANGDLTGFGGGLPKKKKLLALEGKQF